MPCAQGRAAAAGLTNETEGNDFVM